MKIQRDDWQEEIFQEEERHILLAKGRRIGATHLFAEKGVKWMRYHHNPHPTSQVVCASLSINQAQLMIAFATQYAQRKYPELIGKGKNKPTLNRLVLVVDGNKRIFLAQPVGDTGRSSRGFEGQVLIVDEAPFQPDLFFNAATPILATTNGRIWMFGTFDGQEGYFWKNYKKAIIDKNPKARFRVWEMDTETVSRKRPICESWTKEQHDGLIEFLAEEKEDRSEMSYAQEYLAIAALDKRQFYSDEWIEKVCHIDEEEQIIPKEGDNYGGFDLARMGGDYFTAEIGKKITDTNLIQIDHYTRRMLLTTDNEDLIMEYTRKHDCKMSGIDAGSGSLGVSILDHLMKISDMKNRIYAMNNRTISIDQEDGKQRLFNEDMHDNVRAMGFRGELHLYNSDDIKASFRSVRWDKVQDSHGMWKVKISGKNTHIVEGIMRFAELASKDKDLKCFIRSL